MSLLHLLFFFFNTAEFSVFKLSFIFDVSKYSTLYFAISTERRVVQELVYNYEHIRDTLLSIVPQYALPKHTFNNTLQNDNLSTVPKIRKKTKREGFTTQEKPFSRTD